MLAPFAVISVIVRFFALVPFSSPMEMNTQTVSEIKEFSTAIRYLFNHKEAGVLERTTELAKTEAVQQNFNDFCLFMECIDYFKNLRHTVNHDDTYLTVFKILLDCPALDISEVPIMDFYGDMFFLPREVSSKMLQMLQPTEAHIQELLNYHSRPRCCKNMLMASDFLAWSISKVSDQLWVALLDLQIPNHKDDRTLFLKDLLPSLIKNIGDLKRKIEVANNTGHGRASRFLSPIVGIVTFLAATSDIGQNEHWLPAEVLASIVEMLRVEMLTLPEYNFSF